MRVPLKTQVQDSDGRILEYSVATALELLPEAADASAPADSAPSLAASWRIDPLPPGFTVTLGLFASTSGITDVVYAGGEALQVRSRMGTRRRPVVRRTAHAASPPLRPGRLQHYAAAPLC